MINVYDFDKTIYNGDSTIDFYLFCLKKHPIIIILLPKQFFAFILYKLRIKPKIYFKEKFFSFLKYIKEIDKTVDSFWIKKKDNIKKWYIDNKNKTDVIISASPEFLLNPMKDYLKIDAVIASKVNEKGKFLSANCYGEEKVKRFRSLYKNTKINNFYTDSKSDLPMARIATNAFIVKKDKIKTWEVSNEVK